MPLTTPRSKFYSLSGLAGGKYYEITEKQGEAMFGVNAPSAAGSFKGKRGYIMDGAIECDTMNGNYQSATIAYYVDGGASGTGYMYVSLNGNVTNNEQSLCHMMGCLSPQDVKFAGLTNSMLPYNYVQGDDGTTENRELYLVPETQRVLLVSMEGVTFVVQYHFTQGMCTISLCYARAYIVKEEDVEGDGVAPQSAAANQLAEKATTEAEQIDTTMDAAVSINRPYVVVPN